MDNRNNDTARPIIVARAKGVYSDDSSEDRDDMIEPIIAAKAKGIYNEDKRYF